MTNKVNDKIASDELEPTTELRSWKFKFFATEDRPGWKHKNTKRVWCKIVYSQGNMIKSDWQISISWDWRYYIIKNWFCNKKCPKDLRSFDISNIYLWLPLDYEYSEVWSLVFCFPFWLPFFMGHHIHIFDEWFYINP